MAKVIGIHGDSRGPCIVLPVSRVFYNNQGQIFAPPLSTCPRTINGVQPTAACEKCGFKHEVEDNGHTLLICVNKTHPQEKRRYAFLRAIKYWGDLFFP